MARACDSVFRQRIEIAHFGNKSKSRISATNRNRASRQQIEIAHLGNESYSGNKSKSCDSARTGPVFQKRRAARRPGVGAGLRQNRRGPFPPETVSAAVLCGKRTGSCRGGNGKPSPPRRHKPRGRPHRTNCLHSWFRAGNARVEWAVVLYCYRAGIYIIIEPGQGARLAMEGAHISQDDIVSIIHCKTTLSP